MKPARKTKIQESIKILRKALRSAKMKDARFSEDGSTNPHDDTRFTDLVKDRTKLYRQSWIISPTERAIEILKHELER